MVNKKYLTIYLTVLSLIVFTLALFFAGMPIELLDIFVTDSPSSIIVFKLRLPRLLNALLVGASLGVAGACFQGILKNPLADPYVLGVSSGSALGAAFAFLIGFSGQLISFFAVIGAVSSIYLVSEIVRKCRFKSSHNYILAGIIVNAFFAAFLLLLMYLAEKELSYIMHWLMGDLGSLNTAWILVSFLVVIPVCMVLFKRAHMLNAICLGEIEALSLGVNAKQLKHLVFILASLLTGIAVANAGMIGFVGLVIPHLMRILGSSDFNYLLPHSALAGSLFLMTVDSLNQFLSASIYLPIGVVTSFIGAPFFLWVFLNSERYDRA